MEEIYQAAAAALRAGKAICMATIISAQGSTPRAVGAKMLIYAEGAPCGTIGGGVTEAQIIRDAQAALADGHSTRGRYALPDEVDPLSRPPKGEVEVFFDVSLPARELLLIGGGHIALALAQFAPLLGWRLLVADDREGVATAERFPMAERTLRLEPGRVAEAVDISERTAIVIATWGHEQDEAALQAVVGSRAAYIGLVSSRQKARAILENLLAAGVNREQLARVYTPIGLDVGSQTPAEIALSIVAEILLATHGGSGRPLRESRNPLFQPGERGATLG